MMLLQNVSQFNKIAKAIFYSIEINQQFSQKERNNLEERNKNPKHFSQIIYICLFSSISNR